MRSLAKALATALIAGSTAISIPMASAESWGPWGDNSYGSGDASGRGDFAGDGTGEGEAEFGMDFKGRGNTRGNFRGDGDTSWRGDAYGYDSGPYWGGYGPYGGAPAYPTPPAYSGGGPGYGNQPAYGGGPWGGWRPPAPPRGPWGTPPGYPQAPAMPAGR